jgi:hypothetical protein
MKKVFNTVVSIIAMALTVVMGFEGIACSAEVFVIKEEPGDNLFSPAANGKYRLNKNNFMQKFYQYPYITDLYDFIIVTSTSTAKNFKSSHNIRVNSDIENISVGNISTQYSDRLKSLAVVTTAYIVESGLTDMFWVEELLPLVAHEIAHHWCCFTPGLFKEPYQNYWRIHWPSFIDLFADQPANNHVDIMGYHNWKDSSDCVDANYIDVYMNVFSDFTLYLMGLKSPGDISPVINHDYANPGNYLESGPDCTDNPTFTGQDELTIHEFMALNGGPRNPTASTSQKHFNVCFVAIIPEGGVIPDGAVEFYDMIMQELPGYWENATSWNASSTLSTITVITPDDPCISNISIGTGIGFPLTSDCESAHRGGRYAKYYTLTLPSTSLVKINLNSPHLDTYLYLLNGEGKYGSIIDCDNNGGVGTNSYITRTLSPGTYTIEATTFSSGQTGFLSLSLPY